MNERDYDVRTVEDDESYDWRPTVRGWVETAWSLGSTLVYIAMYLAFFAAVGAIVEYFAR